MLIFHSISVEDSSIFSTHDQKQRPSTARPYTARAGGERQKRTTWRPFSARLISPCLLIFLSNIASIDLIFDLNLAFEISTWFIHIAYSFILYFCSSRLSRPLSARSLLSARSDFRNDSALSRYCKRSCSNV